MYKIERKNMLNNLQLKDINPVIINLTGVRLLVLFALLAESPKSAEEINTYFKQNNYPKDLFSIDTLRNDLNALRNAGCTISRADKSSNFKYNLLSHPFELNIDKNMALSFSKIYNKYLKIIPLPYLIAIDNLLTLLSCHTKDNDSAEILKGISIIKNIDKDIIKTLASAIMHSRTVIFQYKAPYIGLVDYEFMPEKFEIRSKKLYIDGYLTNYKRSSFLPVSRITSKVTEKIIKQEPTSIKREIYTTIYELKNTAMLNFEENEEEKLIDTKEDKIIVEYKTDSFFKITQKVLSYGPNCTVLEPEGARIMIINTLLKMKDMYINE